MPVMPEDEHDARVDPGAVEQRAVPGDQVAEAVGRAQHLGHDDADDHERAPEAQRGHHGRQARGQGDVEDLLGAGGSERAGGLGERGAERGHAGHRGQQGRDEGVDRGEGDLRLRAQAEPHHHHRVEHDERHRVGAPQHRQQHPPRRRRGADELAREDAAAADDDVGDRDLAEGGGQAAQVLAPVGDERAERLAERRHEEARDDARARQQLPGREDAQVECGLAETQAGHRRSRA